VLNLLPLWIRQNLRLIGFQVYTQYIWEKFIVYLMYFTIGVYVQEQMIVWKVMDKNAQNVELIDRSNKDDDDELRNSDNQPYYPGEE
jgi:hypothetical protein